MKLFENNQLVDNSLIYFYLKQQGEEHIPDNGKNWLFSFHAIPMLTDLCNRSDTTFTTPWGKLGHRDYLRLPKLEHTNEDLGDIFDKRAIEIDRTAARDNKEVYIMWSGGVDSTSMLCAFIRNIDPRELKSRYSIVLSSNSIAENFYFYQKYISGKFRIVNWLDIDVTECFLDRAMLLHGDPANALMSCPTTSAFQHLVDSDQHLLDRKNNLGLLVEGLERFVEKSDITPPQGWAEWYVSKINDAIPAYDGAASLAAFWWWHYINFKWHGSIMRPLIYMRKDKQRPISDHYVRYYYENSFYVSKDLHDWSYSNIDRIVADPYNYKPEMKKYILDTVKDELYFKHKGFKSSRRTDLNYVTTNPDTAVVYDENWVGHSMLSISMKDDILDLLRRFS